MDIIQNASVVIVDDDLKVPPLSHLSELLPQKLNNENSVDYVSAKEYCVQRGAIAENDDIDSIISYFGSEAFIKKILSSEIPMEIFSNEVQEELTQGIDAHKQSSMIFDVIKSTFSREDCQLTEFTARPLPASELQLYEFVFMDVMMGREGEVDSVESTAKYISDISAPGQEPPIIILMSSRDQLEVDRHIARKHAHIGPSGLFVIAKDRLLQLDGKEYLSLVLNHMRQLKNESKIFRDLCLLCESEIDKAWGLTREALWNMDFNYLQQMHANSFSENQSFSSHLLDLVGHHHLHFLEKADELYQKFLEVEVLFAGAAEKYQSYSREASAAVHKLESSKHCTGIQSIGRLQFPEGVTEVSQLNDNQINRIVPFGAILCKSTQIEEGMLGLIHITQECDLSRNIIKEQLSLLFIEVEFLSAKNGAHKNGSIPTVIGESLWWVSVKKKRLIARPASEMIQLFINEQWCLVAKARPDVTRQFRAETFGQLSRFEAAVRTGHMIYPVKASIKYLINGAAEECSFDNERILYLSCFTTKQGNKDFFSYHLFGDDNYSLSILIMNLLSEKGLHPDITLTQLENKLRNGLPSSTDNPSFDKQVNLFPAERGVKLDIIILDKKTFGDIRLNGTSLLVAFQKA